MRKRLVRALVFVVVAAGAAVGVGAAAGAIDRPPRPVVTDGIIWD
jgi:hypothetical protein